LKRGFHTVASVTVYLTTEADNPFSLHCLVMSTDVMSDCTGHQDTCHSSRWSKTLTSWDGLER